MAFDQNKPAASGTLASADVRNNFQHLKSAVSKEHKWSDSDPKATTHNLDVINISVTASTQGNITTGGSIGGRNDNGGGSAPVLNQIAGIGGGTYNLKSIIQNLVNRSHTHGTSILSQNCNCNCSDDST